MQIGVGMAMEGIDQNPVVYDLMSEMAFRSSKFDVKVNQLLFEEYHLFFFPGSFPKLTRFFF